MAWPREALRATGLSVPSPASAHSNALRAFHFYPWPARRSCLTFITNFLRRVANLLGIAKKGWQSIEIKTLLFLFSFGVSFDCFCQKKSEEVLLPFQVMVSKNAVTQKGEPIENLQFISINDSLKINKDGFVSLIHISGFPLEYNKDTVLSAKRIHQSFLKLSAVSRGRKSKYEYKRPRIENLSITNLAIAHNEKASNMGACLDCRGADVIYPPSHNFFGGVVHHDGKEMCLMFRKGKSNHYKIDVINVFGDFIDSLSTSSNELLINAQMLEKWRGKDGSVLLNIKDKGEDKYQSFMIVLQKSPWTDIEFPWRCEPIKASYALMAGFYLEWSRGEHLDEAEKYYVLATKLSNDPFYQMMLENFRKRTGKP